MKGHEYIKQRREALGMSQRALARKIRRLDGDGSISPQMMNCIEHGRRSYEPYIEDLADALLVDDWILCFYVGRFPKHLIDGYDGDNETIMKAYSAFVAKLRGECDETDYYGH